MMNIKISYNWISEVLKTNISVKKLSELVSLSGPSIEKLEKITDDTSLDIEITTNRIDTASVLGFAREAKAILERENIKSEIKAPQSYTPNVKKSLPVKLVYEKGIVKRLAGFIISDIKNWKTPVWMKERLEISGVRSKNAIVDITNYVMIETGHPIHAFDYDKIKNGTIIVCLSKRGEKITSFDNKTYILPGGDIIFKSVDGKIIDLPGIIGTKNSVIEANTKQVLFFIDNNDPLRIRKTSMALNIRTLAAQMNEGGVDPELGIPALKRAAYLSKSILKCKFASKIFDTYLEKPKPEKVSICEKFIEEKLGIKIPRKEIIRILKSLEFKVREKKDSLEVVPPSFRTEDIKIKEDLVEEIARIYGYHKLPSNLIPGKPPKKSVKKIFSFEYEIKNFLSALGGIELYTLSLVPKRSGKTVTLLNELGTDTKYLRTTLLNSLVKVARNNKSEKEKFFIYEMSNIYLNKKSCLPEEKTMLAGIFAGWDWKNAKGIVEAFMDKFNIDYSLKPIEKKYFKPGQCIKFISRKKLIGTMGVEEENGYIYFEMPVALLFNVHKMYKKVILPSKFPPQIEDLTARIPEKTYIGDVITEIRKAHKHVSNVRLVDTYKRNFTFRINYHSKRKTLTDPEVKKAREVVIRRLRENFAVEIAE